MRLVTISLFAVLAMLPIAASAATPKPADAPIAVDKALPPAPTPLPTLDVITGEPAPKPIVVEPVVEQPKPVVEPAPVVTSSPPKRAKKVAKRKPKAEQPGVVQLIDGAINDLTNALSTPPDPRGIIGAK